MKTHHTPFKGAKRVSNPSNARLVCILASSSIAVVERLCIGLLYTIVPAVKMQNESALARERGTFLEFLKFLTPLSQCHMAIFIHG